MWSKFSNGNYNITTITIFYLGRKQKRLNIDESPPQSLHSFFGILRLPPPGSPVGVGGHAGTRSGIPAPVVTTRGKQLQTHKLIWLYDTEKNSYFYTPFFLVGYFTSVNHIIENGERERSPYRPCYIKDRLDDQGCFRSKGRKLETFLSYGGRWVTYWERHISLGSIHEGNERFLCFSVWHLN